MFQKVLTNLVSFVLPITVLYVVPEWLTGFTPVKLTALVYPGIVLLLVGLIMLALTIIAFIRKGKGTLAPWSPTKKLVISGLHAFVRNPMISGVAIILCGEALIFYFLKILIWLLIFVIINHVYFIFVEEPSLLNRFGSEYSEYKSHVGRWIPRIRPYNPDNSRSS
jgi:protein-S-isoprenylcysteine O-methyltransferase Ste14